MKRTARIYLLIILSVVVSVGGYYAYQMYLFSKGVQEDAKRLAELDLPDTVDLHTNFQEGDLIFQTSLSSQSKAIQLATNSPFSHMGIIYIEEDKYYVYEAIQPVKLTPLSEWINRGKSKQFVVKRLRNADEILTADAISKLKNEGKKYLGKDYDIYFEWSDERIYCSELVWKMYKDALGIEIGQTEKLGDFDLSSEEVRAIMQKRYGDNIPMDEEVISPKAMYESELLKTVPITKLIATELNSENVQGEELEVDSLVQKFDNGIRFELSNVKKSNWENLKEDSIVCTNWNLTEEQISLVISGMKPIRGEEWHHLFGHFPCEYNGIITQDTLQFNFTLNSGSWAILHNSSGQWYYGDTEGKFEELFIDGVWKEGEDY